MRGKYEYHGKGVFEENEKDRWIERREEGKKKGEREEEREGKREGKRQKKMEGKRKEGEGAITCVYTGKQRVE